MRLFPGVSALVLAAAAAGCASPDPGGFRGPDGALVVPLHEGPRNVFAFDLWIGPEAIKARFLLDTGSSFTAVSPHLASEADPRGVRRPVLVEGVHESRTQEVFGGVARFAFRPSGGRAFESPDRAFWELAIPHGHDGLAGLSAFPGRLVVLDLPAGVVVVRDGRLPAPDGRACLPLRIENGVPSVRVDAAGVVVDAAVDTGFFGTLFVPPGVAAQLPLAEQPSGTVRVRDVHGDRVLEERRLLGTLRIGDRILYDTRVLVGPGEPLLGVGALRGMRVTFDLAGSCALFEDAAPASARATVP